MVFKIARAGGQGREEVGTFHLGTRSVVAIVKRKSSQSQVQVKSKSSLVQVKSSPSQVKSKLKVKSKDLT